MNTITSETQTARIQSLKVSDEELVVDLVDGRTLAVPVGWFPRLAHATPKERAAWRLIGQGHGVHWAELDEDISVDNLLAGKQSGESQRSFKRWLEGRAKRRRKG
ncbi:MAG: DUF2442 domain-containing protein [Planctomycetota bacterium]|nr:DUF2442 domain-containing protein [Planctomycetota bacterium]